MLLMGVFSITFLPMHYRSGYDLGKPFLLSGAVQFVLILVLEALEHMALALWPLGEALFESYALSDQLRQLPVLVLGACAWLLLNAAAFRISAARFERVDL